MTEPHGGGSKQEVADLRIAESHIAARDWANAKPILLRLAAANRAERRYLALLAFVLGHEAMSNGDAERARVEWARAVALDPSLESRGVRRRRASFVQRWFGRS